MASDNLWLGLRVLGSGFRFQGSGFRFRVYGLGLVAHVFSLALF